jgi:serine/threonine protein kinase/Tol biopolymer transport system component
MGEVYRATDTKLGRSVAIKTLPITLASDRDRLARFEREAKLLAALNHAHIGSVYSLDEHEGALYIAMELIEGETLETRLKQGALPVGDALDFALQIAQALEAAHDKGVIHRDLKPANIMITPDGVIKVLDFGLAKAVSNDRGETSPAHSPALSLAMTQVGLVLGTAGYMSPEQASAQATDQRADVWAFGVVLYEMLTGLPAFSGESVPHILADVLRADPDWARLPKPLHPRVRLLLERCLVKKPRNRLHSMADARIEIEAVRSDPAGGALESAATTTTRAWSKVLPWALAPLLFVAGWLLQPTPRSDRTASQFEELLPDGRLLLHNSRHGLALSADGRRVAFVAATQGNQDSRRIYVRNLDQREAVAIAGTERGVNPFFSPDGHWLGFRQGQQIKKVAIAGGTPQVLIENLGVSPGPDWSLPGASWGGNGMIVYANNLGSGLSAIRDVGGDTEELTSLDTDAHEVSHRLPHFLPDGNSVLFTVLLHNTVTPDWSRAQVWVKSFDTGQRKLLLDDALDARYAGDGVLVFARQARLYAVAFDPETLAVTGEPVPVLEGVVHSLYGTGAVSWSGAAQFDVSEDGSLLYAPGSIEAPQISLLAWVDRQGNVSPVTGMRAMARFAARVSPDGKYIGYSELHVNKDIWTFDPARGIEERATDQGQNAFPLWSPDGAQMAFRSDRAGPLRIYLSPGVGSRDVRELTTGPFDVPAAWTPDGSELILTRGFSSLGGNTDIYVVSLDDPTNPRPLLQTAADERFPELSPDGRWLAYVSDETGRPELYVQPYGRPGRRVTITNNGAQDPAWSKNSNELFYREGLVLMSVRFSATDVEFVPERPVALFQRQAWLGAGTSVRATYDVAPDGRFLVNQPIADVAAERASAIFPSRLRFVSNWTQEVQRLLAPR